jgi:hypothetical protein
MIQTQALAAEVGQGGRPARWPPVDADPDADADAVEPPATIIIAQTVLLGARRAYRSRIEHPVPGEKTALHKVVQMLAQVPAALLAERRADFRDTSAAVRQTFQDGLVAAKQL